MEVWACVPWGSKSFSPRRGRVAGVEEEVVDSWDRAERKRKSCVSSVRSGGGGWMDGSRDGDCGGDDMIGFVKVAVRMGQVSEVEVVSPQIRARRLIEKLPKGA